MKKYLLLYLAIFAAAFALLLVMSLTVKPQTEPEPESPGAVPVGESGAVVTDADCVLIIQTECTLCHHTAERVERGAGGMTREALTERFPEMDIVSFGRDTVLLRRTLDVCCPVHPILWINGGALCVCRNDPSQFAPELLMRLDVPLERFPPDERIRLKRGLFFESYDELNAYIDAYDS